MCDFHRGKKKEEYICIGCKNVNEKEKVKMTHTCFSLLVSLLSFPSSSSFSWGKRIIRKKYIQFLFSTLRIWWRQLRLVERATERFFTFWALKKKYRIRGKEQIHRCFIISRLSGINIRSWPYGKGVKIRIFPHGKHLVLIPACVRRRKRRESLVYHIIRFSQTNLIKKKIMGKWMRLSSY